MHPRLLALLDKHDIAVEHPDEVLAEARALAEAPGIDDPRLIDRTDLPLCTIDEPTSMDLDQALFVEETATGHRVWYAIADAAWFVRPRSALWAEALKRGSSFYLPAQVIPMLPRILSEDLVSLVAGADRRSLLFVVDLDARGKARRARLERARVRSRAKLNYQGVQDWYDGTGPSHADPQVEASLRALVTVGTRRMQLAEERGVVPFRRREVVIRHDDDTDRMVAFEDLRRPVERYNEQISLLCNVEGARFLRRRAKERSSEPIYRVHPPPDPQRLGWLRQRVDALVDQRALDPGVWRWDVEQAGLADWLSALPEEGEDGRLAEVLHRQAIVTSGRASFRATPGAHHGVGAEIYGRFTAPMREMVGVYLHGQATEHLDGEDRPLPEGFTDDEAVRSAVIRAAEVSRNLQRALDRETNRIVLDEVLAEDLASGGRPRVGTLMGLSRRKLHVRLEDPPLDLKVYLHHLERQAAHRLSVDDDRTVLRRGKEPVLHLGDRLALQTIGTDRDADRWEFRLAGEAAQRLAPPGAK